MKSFLHKALRTLQNDGLGVLILRMYNFSIVKVKRLFEKDQTVNIAKWHTLKDKYKGQRLFVLGNGPSLNETPLYLLKGEYTMCFNRINLMFDRLNWKPNFYVVADDLVVKDNYAEMNTEIIPVVDYAFFPDIHPSNVDFTKLLKEKENVLWFKGDIPAFRADLPNCGINKTVVNAGLQIAAYLGFEEIYLLGVDMTFGQQKIKKLNSRNWVAAENDPNHFDPRYFQKGKKYHNPTVHEMIEKFEAGKLFLEGIGVKTYNAGIGGKLEVFPRVAFADLFKYKNKEVIEKDLDETVMLQTKRLSFDYVKKNAQEIVTAQTESLPDIFFTSLVLGLKLIPVLTTRYIAVGPIYEKYYFIKAE